MFPPLPRSSLLKIPRQRRSIEMVHAILDAGIVVLEKEGVLEFSTNRVARVAGVSVGSLYQYFANKEMIVAGIVERGVVDVEHMLREAVMNATNVEVEAAVEAGLLVVIQTLAPYRRLLAEVMAVTPLLAERGVTAVLETRISDAVRDFLVANSDRYALPGGPATLYIVVNGAIYVVLKWLSEGPAHISGEELARGLAHQFGRVIVARTPSAYAQSARPSLTPAYTNGRCFFTHGWL